MSKEIDFRKMMSRAPRVRLETIIEEAYHPNTNDEYWVDDVSGVANTKGFIYTKANLEERNLKKFNQIRPKYFAFNRRTTRKGERIDLEYNETASTYICTEDYVVFRVKDEYLLKPGFLYLIFNRPEFDRYSRFNSWGSARETFDWSEMQRFQIPLPPIEVQEAIVSICHCMEEAKSIAREARELMKNICPALIQKAAKSN